MAATGDGGCEVKHTLCKGTAVAKFKGRKAGDPVFRCCFWCLGWLRKQGVKVKQVP